MTTRPSRRGDPSRDERDVRSLYEALLNCWNSRDAGAFASLFTTDGNTIGFDGSQVDGPQDIEASLRRIFADHPTAAYVARIRGVRLLSAGVAVLRAVAGMVPPGGSDINPAVNAIQTLVAAKVDGRWRIAVFQNTPARFHGRPELVQQLTEELRQVLHAAASPSTA